MHDAKGIKISRGSISEPDASILLKWNKVDKRISELIAADRYLNSAEKDQYPAYRETQELREARWGIGKEFQSIIRDYNDFQEQLGNIDAKLNQYVLVDCGSEFGQGSKTTFTLGEDNFILPLMRNAMHTIIAEDTHLTERCNAMLISLDSDLAKPLEPTYEDLNPPPEPEKEYRFSLGDTAYIGSQQYEILSFNENEVCLYDPQFPLFNKTLLRAEFDSNLSENPMNDHLLQVVEDAEPETLVETNIGKMPVEDYHEIVANTKWL